MGDDYVRRTAITRLETTGEQRDALTTTIDEWLRGCQLATDLARPDLSNNADLQLLADDAMREQTDLGRQHDILAIR